MRIALLLAALLVTFPAVATGAAPAVTPLDHLPALKGDYFPLASKSTGTTYHIYVRLPLDYAEQTARRYPVVYLLDGDSAFPLLSAQHLFMTIDDKTPEAILVGIAYGGFGTVNKRERDFGEGAPAFQRFLADELLPAIEQRVRADTARRILVGQSFGGTFTLWSALNRPGLFWGHVASNPSFRLHQERLLAPAASSSPTGGRLALVSGTLNSAPGRAGALAWYQRHSGGRLPWTLRRFDIEGGTHSADLGRAYRLAIGWMLGREPG
jgi:predicted alpha/beta superfamily hydrolase